MKRVSNAWVAAVALTAALAAPVVANGDQFVEIGDTGLITPSQRSRVIVPITVNCESNTAPEAGTATVTLSQAYRGTTTTGTGQTQVTCDGVTRTYLVTVDSPDGQFRKGPATATATVTFPYQVCIEDPSGNRQCSTFTMTMRDEEEIELRIGR
jgi:hypothetical protein